EELDTGLADGRLGQFEITRQLGDRPHRTLWRDQRADHALARLVQPGPCRTHGPDVGHDAVDRTDLPPTVPSLERDGPQARDMDQRAGLPCMETAEQVPHVWRYSPTIPGARHRPHRAASTPLPA